MGFNRWWATSLACLLVLPQLGSAKADPEAFRQQIQASLLPADPGKASAFQQVVPAKRCRIEQPENTCFDKVLEKGKRYVVSPLYSEIGGEFSECVGGGAVEVKNLPIRVVFVLDRSGSMCQSSDAGDKRLKAADEFVERLAKHNPDSEVGVVHYAGGSRDLQFRALPLNSTENIRRIHDAIAHGACSGYSFAKQSASSDNQATQYTPTGLGLERGIELVDENYEAIKDSLERHVILLIDGEWHDAGTMSPDYIYNTYRENKIGQTFPNVHGIYISQGGRGTNDLHHLERISKGLTGGLYFNGTTSNTVSRDMAQILDHISIRPNLLIRSATITHVQTGQVYEPALGPDGRYEDNRWRVRPPPIPIAYGDNTYIMKRVIFDRTKDKEYTTLVDTLRIHRPREGVADVGGFSYACQLTKRRIFLGADPRIARTDQPAELNALAQPGDIIPLLDGLDKVRLRGFVPYSGSEDGTHSLFPFNGDLSPAAGTLRIGGTPALAEGAFGQGIARSETFTLKAPSLTGDYAVELWLKLDYLRRDYKNPIRIFEADEQNFFKLNGYADDQHGDTVATWRLGRGSNIDFPISLHVWNHVALVQNSGQRTVYINGVEAGSRSGKEAFGGNLTFGDEGVHIDELRITEKPELTTEDGVTMYRIPTLPGIQWQPGGGAEQTHFDAEFWRKADSHEAVILAGGGNGTFIPNFYHIGSDPELRWSQNAPSVRQEQDVPVRAELADLDGDGYLDALDLVWIIPMQPAAVLPEVGALVEGVEITGLETGTRIPLKTGNMEVLSDRLRVKLQEVGSGELQTGWRDARVTLNRTPVSADGRALILESVVDAAGPVLVSAEIRSGSPDTLWAKVSEPLEWKGDGKPDETMDYFRGSSAFSGALAGISADAWTRGEREIAIPLSNGHRIETNRDSLALKGASPLFADRSGNAARNPNRKVPIIFKGGVAVTLALRDGDADGYLDQVELRWTQNFVLRKDAGRYFSELSLVTLDGKRLDLGRLEHIESGAGRALLNLAENRDAIHTGWREATAALVPEAFDAPAEASFQVTEIRDVAAPVALEAEFRYWSYLGKPEDEVAIDTLTVRLSEEPRGEDHRSPFRLIDARGTGYGLELELLERQGNLIRYRVVGFPDNMAPKRGDSLWIETEAGLGDGLGNVQANPNNRRVALRVFFPPGYANVSMGPLAQAGAEDVFGGESFGLLGIDIQPVESDNCCAVSEVLREADVSIALKDMEICRLYSCLEVVLSSPGRVESRIFDNLGQFVTQFAFSLDAESFDRLPTADMSGMPQGTARADMRRLILAWDGTVSDNLQVQTGAFLWRYRVTLQPGGEEPQQTIVDVLRFGRVRR